MDDSPKVIARHRSSSQDAPRFTATAPLAELIETLRKNLPVDIVYTLIKDPKGAGYILEPIGTLSIDLIPFTAEDLRPPTPTYAPPKIIQPEPNTEVLANEAPKMESIVDPRPDSKGDSPEPPANKKKRRGSVLPSQDEAGAKAEPVVPNEVRS